MVYNNCTKPLACTAARVVPVHVTAITFWISVIGLFFQSDTGSIASPEVSQAIECPSSHVKALKTLVVVNRHIRMHNATLQ